MKVIEDSGEESKIPKLLKVIEDSGESKIPKLLTKSAHTQKETDREQQENESATGVAPLLRSFPSILDYHRRGKT